MLTCDLWLCQLWRCGCELGNPTPTSTPPPSLATQEAAAGVIIRSTEGSKIGMLEMKLSHYLKSIMSFSISPFLHLLNMRLSWPMLSHESSPRHQQPISQQHTYTRQATELSANIREAGGDTSASSVLTLLSLPPASRIMSPSPGRLRLP